MTKDSDVEAIRAAVGGDVEGILLEVAGMMENAAQRNATDLVSRVLDAEFATPLEDVERSTALENVFRELVRPGAPPLTTDQVEKIEALLEARP